MFMFGDTGTVAVQYEPVLGLHDLWKVEQSAGRVNRLLKLVMSIPELAVRPAILESLEQVLDSEVVYFSPQRRSGLESFKNPPPESNPDDIHFKNPFPQEPSVEVGQIVGASLALIETMRWSDDVCNNLVELIQDELENSSRLFYISMLFCEEARRE